MALGSLLNPLIHPGQNKDVQEIVKKFFVRRKVKQRDFCELVTVNKNECEEAALATGGEEEHEWWIIIKLQVDRLGKYCSKIVVEQAELCEVCSHKEPISVVSALGAGTRAGHSPHICDCSAPECRGTGV